MTQVMTQEQINMHLELIKKLQAENEALKAKATAPKLGMKVSEKGALSLYGMGRFPITLYKEQWRKVLAKASEIEAYIQANDALLKSKE